MAVSIIMYAESAPLIAWLMALHCHSEGLIDIALWPQQITDQVDGWCCPSVCKQGLNQAANLSLHHLTAEHSVGL